jgi:hybrid cluster-associated redox disulfide protein
MRDHERAEPTMLVDTVMRRWPRTIAVFLRHDMLCIGCTFGTYCSVADACAEHGLDLDTFWAELASIIEEAADDPLRQHPADAATGPGVARRTAPGRADR